MKDTSIIARFEGHEIIEHGVAQIPNLLLAHYTHLGLSDVHFALIVHVIARKWTANAPYPTITKLPLSCELSTRRTYVRDLRNMGLLFTRRKYWTNEDALTITSAQPGRLRSNEWYLGSLLHNAVRVHTYLKTHSLDNLTTIEVPAKTVQLFLSGHFHDTPSHVTEAIEAQAKQAASVLLQFDRPLYKLLRQDHKSAMLSVPAPLDYEQMTDTQLLDTIGQRCRTHFADPATNTVFKASLIAECQKHGSLTVLQTIDQVLENADGRAKPWSYVKKVLNGKKEKQHGISPHQSTDKDNAAPDDLDQQIAALQAELGL